MLHPKLVFFVHVNESALENLDDCEVNQIRQRSSDFAPRNL
jgi:hypothetical protein